MREVARRVARGDFTEMAPARVSGELGELATALTTCHRKLAARIRELSEEKADLGAILAGMTEGVLVVRPDGRIRLTKPGAANPFAITEEAVGKPCSRHFATFRCTNWSSEVTQKGDVAARD